MTARRIENLRHTEDVNNICSGDCCISAVRRAYAGMLTAEQPESVAFDAALAVFKWHHPEVTKQAAATLVRGWVLEHSAH